MDLMPCQQRKWLEDPYLCVRPSSILSLSGFDVVQVWKRVNPVRRVVTLLRDMAGAGEVKFLRVCAECPCCLLLSGFFLDCVHPHS